MTELYLVLNVHDIEQIEQVQRRFTKRLPELNMYSYTTRPSKLNVPSLELRGLHIDLIMCYKIFSLVRVKFDDFFHLSTVATTRGHPLKLFKEYNSVDARKLFLVKALLMCGTICHQILLT